MSESLLHIGNDETTIKSVTEGIVKILEAVAKNQGELRMSGGDIEEMITNFARTAEVKNVSITGCDITGPVRCCTEPQS